MVLESGKEGLEQLGGEVPSLAVEKGSAFLQHSWCPGEMLLGIWAMPWTVLLNLRISIFPWAMWRCQAAAQALGRVDLGFPWLRQRGAARNPVFLPLSRRCSVWRQWQGGGQRSLPCFGRFARAVLVLPMGSDEAQGCWLAAAPVWGTLGFAGEMVLVCCAWFLVAARGCSQPCGC